MSRSRVVPALLAGALLLAGCGGAAQSEDGADEPRSTEAGAPATHAGSGERLDLQLVSDITPGEEAGVGAAVNAFGFDLLGELSTGEENAVTSPISVATLLAMVLAGTGGDTAEAIAEVLHLDDSRDVRVGALLRQLADTDDVTVSVANALWGDTGTPFESSYLDFVRDTFGATVDEAELGDQATADEIDAWVSEHTEGLIEKLAADLGLPDPAAALVLVNAVYFLGTWTTQFDPADTGDRPFTLPDGSEVNVPLMHLRGQTLGYTERDGYRMLRLPYGADGRYGMEIMLPDDDSNLAQLLDTVDAAEWRGAVDSLAPEELDVVGIPRFELRWGEELKVALERLGMGIAFGGEADFGPMSPVDQWLDGVVHKTYIRVDEKGTEAAAVTGGVTRSSLSSGFVANRPFAFTISDRETDTILFLGAVADPRS